MDYSIVTLIYLLILFLIAIGLYIYFFKVKISRKPKYNIIQLQSNGTDFILYKAKTKKIIINENKSIFYPSIIVYSMSLSFVNNFSGKVYFDIPAKSIKSFRKNDNILTIEYFENVDKKKKIIIKGVSNKQIEGLLRKVKYIYYRSKKILEKEKYIF